MKKVKKADGIVKKADGIVKKADGVVKKKFTKKEKKQLTGKKQKKKAWGSKQVLASPFAPSIPPANPSTREAVYNIFLEVFPKPIIFRNVRPSGSTPKEVKVTEVQSSIKTGRNECLNKKPIGILVGINEVTRALEKNKLELVLISRDVTPAIMILHIPPLCFTTSTKLVVLPGDGTDLGQIIGTGQLLAFGITRAPDTKDVATTKGYLAVAGRLLNTLSPLQTKLEYPWLAAANGGPLPPFPDPMVIPHRSKKDIP